MQAVPEKPSIKGSVFRYHVEQILKRVSAGEISRDELSRRLEPGDFALLDTPILANRWYDIGSYERIVLLRRELDRDESHDRLRRYGAETAERLLEAGLYQQLNTYFGQVPAAGQIDDRARFVAFGRELRRLVTLNVSLLNFCRAEAKVDPERSDRYIIEFSDAGAYPEVLCWTSEGFMNRIANHHQYENLWRWTRPEWDRVVYRMTRPF